MPRAAGILLPLFSMKKFFHFLLLALVSAASVTFAAKPAAKKSSNVAANSSVTNIGEIKVSNPGGIVVRVTSNSPDLEKLAKIAFESHGCYRIAVGNDSPRYDFKFSLLSGNIVRADIVTRSGGSVTSQTLSGTSARNALLKAADWVVEKTNGAGLKGFFTAQLAFVATSSGKSEVYTSDLFGGEVMRITRDGAHVISPRWTPNGGKLIYTSYVSGAPDIYLQDPKTGQRNSFARYNGTNTGARYSPNGQQVAMVCGQGMSEIYTSDPMGRQIVRRTRSDAVKSSPCWSPDGTQIIFAMDPGPQLYVIPAYGGAAQRAAMGYSYMAEPDWNRVDRTKVACTVRAPDGKFRIAVADLSTRKASIIEAKEIAFDAVESSWLADGRHVICTLRDRKSSGLAILDTQTGNLRAVSTLAGSLQASVWNP